MCKKEFDKGYEKAIEDVCSRLHILPRVSSDTESIINFMVNLNLAIKDIQEMKPKK